MRGERLEDIREARPELRVALEQAGRFLGLTALATVGLAAAAVALAARHWLGRHTREAAVLATLGATRRLRLAVFAGQLLLAAGAAALLGALVGGVAQMWLVARLAAWAGVALPAAAWPVWLLAPALGLVLVLGLTAVSAGPDPDTGAGCVARGCAADARRLAGPWPGWHWPA